MLIMMPHTLLVQVPAVLVRLCITIVCLPLVWVVISLVILGVGPNDPVLGWRKAIIRPFLKFWARVLLHIGFNFWPRVKGAPTACMTAGVAKAKCWQPKCVHLIMHAGQSMSVV